MSHGNADYAPLDLGVAAGVDPFAIQPGVILFDRFCVIGRVRHAAHSWRVQVTDLQRKLGAVPHHRLELHILPLSEDWERAFRAALPAHQQGQRRIEGILSLPDGLGMLTVQTEGTGLRLPLEHQDALTVARTLSRLLDRVHAVGVAGVRFDLRDIRLDVFGALQFAIWHHVTRLRFSGPQQLEQQADVQSLIELLHTLGDPTVSGVLRDVECHASAVLDRVSSIRSGSAPASAVEVLPAIAPFVGRELPLLRIQEAGSHCRHSGVEVFLVTGQPEVGRSRFLDQLATDFGRGDTMSVLSAGFRQPSPHSGIAVLLEGVAALLQRLTAREREQVVARIQRRVGTNIALFNDACPALTEMVGRYTIVAPPTLDERSIRLAATVADLLSAIATPERPLALLFDDIDQADASIRAVVYQLTIPTRNDPLLVVLSQRPGPKLDIPRPVTELPLGPLPLGAVRTLINVALPGPVVADAQLASVLFDASGGGPAETWSLLQGWVDRGILARNIAGEWHLTDHQGLSNVVALTPAWSELSADARSLAALALVRPEPATPGWLARVTGWTTAVVREAASELVSASVLMQDAGGRLAFAEERGRDRAMDAASDEEIASAHALVAAWMAHLGNASAAQRAWHEEHATPAGLSADLARLHVEAGNTHLTQCDAVRALWHFDCALRRTTDSDLLRSALEGRADALLLQDRNKDALEAYLQVFDRTPSPLQALQIANRVVHAFYLFGDEQACLQVANRALGSVGQRVPRGMFDAGWDVIRSIASITLRLSPHEPKVASALAMVHCYLVASLASARPEVGLSSIFRGLAAATPFPSPARAWARAFFSVIFASMGWKKQMRDILEKAEIDARQAGDSMSLGVVLHFRGQDELSLGSYDVGQSALSAAVNEFRRAGDMSVSVLSMATGALYALDRESLSELETRIQDATAAAWRHRYHSILPLLTGMRELLAARRGEPEPDPSFLDASPTQSDALFGIAGPALSASAQLIRGNRPAALRLAADAYERYLTLKPTPPILANVVVIYAEALIANDDVPTARRIVKQLRHLARSVPAVRVAGQLVSAKLDIREGRSREARNTLIHLVESVAGHQELWHVIEAHRLLSELLAGHDARSATAHAELAARWSERVGMVVRPSLGGTPVPAGPLASPSVDPIIRASNGSERREDIPLWVLLEQLRSTFEKVLPPNVGLTIGAAAGVRAVGSKEKVELLVVNLVLAVRDTLEPPTEVTLSVDEVEFGSEEAARTLEGRAGRWGCVQLVVRRASAPAGRGALAECRSLAALCGGFLDLRPDDEGGFTLSAYLPAPEDSPTVASSQLAAVIHSDERVRGALVEGIRRLGWSAVELPAGEPFPDEVCAVFAERDTLPLLFGFIGEVVPIVRRTDRAPARSIRIPFLVSELEALLDQLKQGPVVEQPISGAPRPE